MLTKSSHWSSLWFRILVFLDVVGVIIVTIAMVRFNAYNKTGVSWKSVINGVPAEVVMYIDHEIAVHTGDNLAFAHMDDDGNAWFKYGSFTMNHAKHRKPTAIRVRARVSPYPEYGVPVTNAQIETAKAQLEQALAAWQQAQPRNAHQHQI